MNALEPQTLTVGGPAAAREIAVLHSAGATPGLIWLGGFMSDMSGTKAEAIAALAAKDGRQVTRFDYSGHGRSGGRFDEGTISRWLEETIAVFERCTTGPQIVIGSSMGGWMALLLARAHRAAVGADASRIKGLVLIAPAVDMTEELLWARYPEAARREILERGFRAEPSDYSDQPYIITRDLIEDGRRHLIGAAPFETGCPVHILQGVLDEPVPWRHAVELVSRLSRDDVVLTLVKDGDHRLSRPEDIDRLIAAVRKMAG